MSLHKEIGIALLISQKNIWPLQVNLHDNAGCPLRLCNGNT